jgi:hypothetical protein
MGARSASGTGTDTVIGGVFISARALPIFVPVLVDQQIPYMQGFRVV